MEEAFEKLQKAGKNNMNDLIAWMKEAKVIDATKEAEEKVKKLFGSEQKDISLAKFKEVVQQVASDQKKNFEEMSKNLAASGNAVAEKLMAGASALKDKLFK